MTSEVYLEIVGLMKEHHFQIAKSIAEVTFSFKVKFKYRHSGKPTRLAS